MKPEFRLFNNEDIEKIQEKVFQVLSETGARILSEEGRNLLKDKGCRLDGMNVHIPETIMLDAIDSTPESFTLFDREGEKAFIVGGESHHFGTGPTTPSTLDLDQVNKHPTLLKDIADAARVCDALEHIEWIMPLGSCQEVPPEVADVYEFEAAVTNTWKPIAFICSDKSGVEDVYKIASAARGAGLDNLREKPFVVSFPEPICPLVHPSEVIDKIFLSADMGMPQAYFPSPLNGATAPVTLAGEIVLGLADALTGLLLAQLRQPGTPFILGVATNIMDMTTGALCHGIPEFSIGVAAHAEVLKAFGIPSWGTAGLTDSKIVDEQAAIESTFSCLLNGLGGLNMIHDVGYMEMGMTGSIEMVVMTNEIIKMVNRLLDGIHINTNTLAAEIINSVGPGGNFLVEEHTAQYFKSESTILPLMDRNNFEKWRSTGAKTLGFRVKERVKELIENHRPKALDSERLKNVEAAREKSVETRKK